MNMAGLFSDSTIAYQPNRVTAILRNFCKTFANVFT